jgi:hypothetical protein
MINLPVIGGTYADLRQVKSRGVWQVVIDVPSEDAEKLVELFGLPRQDEPTWLAIARLKTPPGASTSEPASTSQGESPSKAAGDVGASPQSKAHAAPGGTYSKRAGMRHTRQKIVDLPAIFEAARKRLEESNG